MFEIKFVGKIKIRISKNWCRLYDVEKNVVEPETLKMTIWRRVATWISKATRAQAHARARGPTHTYTYACTRMHFRAHTQTHTLTHVCNPAFPL